MVRDLAPPGWPQGVPPPAPRVGPSSAASRPVPAPRPRAPEVPRPLALLARFPAHHVESALAGARSAYGSARRELGERVTPEVLDQSLRALEAEGARLARASREIALVEDALLGGRWTPRL